MTEFDHITDTGVTTIYLKQDGSFDMRYKTNKDLYKKLQKSRFEQIMQGIANKVGANDHGIMGGALRWELWLSPWYQLHRLLWKYGVNKPYKLS